MEPQEYDVVLTAPKGRFGIELEQGGIFPPTPSSSTCGLYILNSVEFALCNVSEGSDVVIVALTPQSSAAQVGMIGLMDIILAVNDVRVKDLDNAKQLLIDAAHGGNKRGKKGTAQLRMRSGSRNAIGWDCSACTYFNVHQVELLLDPYL
jgi:hypothetical protein